MKILKFIHSCIVILFTIPTILFTIPTVILIILLKLVKTGSIKEVVKMIKDSVEVEVKIFNEDDEAPVKAIITDSSEGNQKYMDKLNNFDAPKNTTK